ncbi:MAG: hypothetical protein WCV99_16890 [Sterolibacterium sp.]|jgi:hypothetical protein
MNAITPHSATVVPFPIDYPASTTYDKLTTEEIKALCEIDVPVNWHGLHMPEWETIPESCRRFYRLKAYWTLRGATDPAWAAFSQEQAEIPIDPKWHAECIANGWRKGLPWQPKTLRELERRFLPAPMPNIHLIIQRCPQMAMIQALRGDVTEPYWWAVLSVTEHASPNLSRECSDGYAGFSDDELNERVNRIHTEGKKPALCERLNSLNANVCSVCKFWGLIRSPIALGFTHEPKRRKGTP